jgi:hypothetical protein
VPFLTDAVRGALGLFAVSLIAGILANMAYVISDDWVRLIGEPITTVIGLAVMVRMWQVFPFDFGASSSWPGIARWLLGLAMAGTTTALVVQVSMMIRRAAGAPPRFGGRGTAQ